MFGQGPQGLVVVPGWVSNLECIWEHAPFVEFAQALGFFARVILFDKRGTGLSDRVGPVPNLETRIDDLRAVMAAVGSQRAVLCGAHRIFKRHVARAETETGSGLPVPRCRCVDRRAALWRQFLGSW